MKKFTLAILLACASFATAAEQQEDAFTRDLGKFFKGRANVPPPPTHHEQSDIIHRWNEISINATGLIIPRWRRVIRACSANSSGQVGPVVRWRLFTSRCSTA